MLRDTLVGLIEPMRAARELNPLALFTEQKRPSDDRPPCLENPRPEGTESTLTENASSPFHAEPKHKLGRRFRVGARTSENKRAHLAYKKGKISTTPAVRLASGSFRQDEDKLTSCASARSHRFRRLVRIATKVGYIGREGIPGGSCAGRRRNSGLACCHVWRSNHPAD